MSALGILNLPQKHTYNKGVFMHKVLNNNSQDFLAQLFINHQSHYTNSRNNLYMPWSKFDSFKTSISFTGASLWNRLPQNIKSLFLFLVPNVICTNICLRIALHQIWTDLFQSRLHKNAFKNWVLYACIHVRPWKNLNSDVSAHLGDLWKTALIICLSVFIISVCSIVALICVYSIARIAC